MTTEKEITAPAIKKSGEKCSGCGQKYLGEKVVKITHVTTSKDKQKCFISYKLDMTKMTEAEVYEFAANAINIQVVRPRLFRKLGSKAVLGKHGSTINPLDHPAERSTAPPEKKVMTQLSKMDKVRYVKFLTMEMGLTEKQAEVNWTKFQEKNK